MASAAQIAANRQNATRSTGPKTEAGKNNSSRNAVAHGLTATQLLLSTEEQAEFDDMREAMLEHCGPATRYEWILFEDTVRAHWLWTRAQCAHTAFLDAVIQAEQKADPKLTAAAALARVFTDDKHARRLRLLMRYVSAAERTFRTAMKELERVVTVRARIEANERYAAKLCAQQETEEIGFVSEISPEPGDPAASVPPVLANPARTFGESDTQEIATTVIR